MACWLITTIIKEKGVDHLAKPKHGANSYVAHPLLVSKTTSTNGVRVHHYYHKNDFDRLAKPKRGVQIHTWLTHLSYPRLTLDQRRAGSLLPSEKHFDRFAKPKRGANSHVAHPSLVHFTPYSPPTTATRKNRCYLYFNLNKMKKKNSAFISSEVHRFLTTIVYRHSTSPTR